MASASLSRRAEASLNEYNHVSRSYLQTATILVKNQIFFFRFYGLKYRSLRNLRQTNRQATR